MWTHFSKSCLIVTLCCSVIAVNCVPIRDSYQFNYTLEVPDGQMKLAGVINWELKEWINTQMRVDLCKRTFPQFNESAIEVQYLKTPYPCRVKCSMWEDEPMFFVKKPLIPESSGRKSKILNFRFAYFESGTICGEEEICFAELDDSITECTDIPPEPTSATVYIPTTVPTTELPTTVETTSRRLSTSTSGSTSTTPSPSTTTLSPSTTTPSRSTTALSPSTTTLSPSTTTPSPSTSRSTTTASPSTTTLSPSTTTPSSSTSTSPLSKPTFSPSTTPSPSTTTLSLSTTTSPSTTTSTSSEPSESTITSTPTKPSTPETSAFTPITSSPTKTTPSRETTILTTEISSTPMDTTSAEQPIQCHKEGYFRNPYDCTRFYRCVLEGSPDKYYIYHWPCPLGLVFDERVKVCNHRQSSPSC